MCACMLGWRQLKRDSCCTHTDTCIKITSVTTSTPLPRIFFILFFPFFLYSFQACEYTACMIQSYLKSAVNLEVSCTTWARETDVWIFSCWRWFLMIPNEWFTVIYQRDIPILFLSWHPWEWNSQERLSGCETRMGRRSATIREGHQIRGWRKIIGEKIFKTCFVSVKFRLWMH